MTRLRKDDIRSLLGRLDAELAKEDVIGEVYVVGGAVMCLALDARDSTNDVDAFLRPARTIRDAAARVAAAAGVPETWLNVAAKGYLSPRGEFDAFLEMGNLRVFTARPEYMLAMKCAALRLGAQFRDVDDVRFLLRYLNVTSVDDALRIVTGYFDESQLAPKTRLVLEELLPAGD